MRPLKLVSPIGVEDVLQPGRTVGQQCGEVAIAIEVVHHDAPERARADGKPAPVRPRASGIFFAGPPGTGKTLLARAVAGGCGEHIETVSGPALISKWVGESEANQAVVERDKASAAGASGR